MAGLELGLKARHGDSGGGARRGEASHRGAVDGDRAPARAGPGGGAAPPFGDAEVATMSATTSAATRRCFGIQRVCQVWERSRSALYARRARAHHRLGGGPARRGPAPRQSDAQLLAAIRTGLARSPFHGEGHRKVHARLRILDGIRPHAGAARHAGARTALPAPRASGRREDPRREGHHPGAQRDVGDGRRAGIHARRRVGLDLRSSRTLERGVRGVARVQSREPLRGTRSDCASNVSMARWTPTSPVGWRFGWITVVSTCQTTSSSRSGIGGSTPASALWRSGGIVRSRSKRSTAGRGRPGRRGRRRGAEPGVSRSITRRSSMSSHKCV